LGLRSACRTEPDRHHRRWKAHQGGRAADKAGLRLCVDRVTGQPVWPIEEQPVPASNVPGERASKTQPFPTKPAPIDLQGVRDEDLNDLTPDIRKEALDIASLYDHGPLFTPPSLRGTIQVPGTIGGASWAGAAIDPETGMFYVSTQRVPMLVTIRKPNPAESSYDFIGHARYLPGPRGLPLLKPPFGSILAIDMNSGEHRWRIPIGRMRRSARSRDWASANGPDYHFAVGRWSPRR
jgi:quinoprotein glucose dehydrogenase